MSLSRHSSALMAGLIVLMTLAAYAPALRAGFVWDDDAHVTNNATLRTLDGLRRIWLEPDALPQYYPLVHTTFWIERHLWGLAPLGYHLVNILLHAGNALLVWLVLRRLAVPGAWVAASLFALHPVHVESVAWVTERKNVLSGCLYLVSALFLLRVLLRGDDAGTDRPRDGSPHTAPKAEERTASESRARRGRAGSRRDAAARHEHSRSRDGRSGLDATREPDRAWRWYLAGFSFFVLALLSKTVSASLPLALAIVLWWKKGRLGRRDLVLLAPLAAAGAVLGSLTVWIEKHHVGAQGQEWALSLLDRALIAGRAPWFYLGKLLWPFDLTFFYPRWSLDPTAPQQWLYPLATIAALLVLWALRRRLGRAPLAAALLFLVTLAPALGLFDVFPMRYSYVADHFQYLASLGPLALFAAGAIEWAERWRARRLAPHLGSSRRPTFFLTPTLAWVPALALLLGLGTLTWSQAHIYKDAETLWRDTLAKNPEAWAAHNNLGLLLARRSEPREAIAHYSEALRLHPDFVEAHINLGNALLREGRPSEAITHYAEAVRLKPDYLIARYNLANALLGQKRDREAIEHFEEIVRLEPSLGPAHERLAQALEREGRTREAAAHEAEGLRLKAWFLATHENPAYRSGRQALELAERARDAAREALAARGDGSPDSRSAAHRGPAASATERGAAPSGAAPLSDGEAPMAGGSTGDDVARGDTTVGLDRPGWLEASILDTMAASYAEMGRFEDAIRTAESARDVARSSGLTDLARSIEGRLEAYAAGRPFRDPSLSRLTVIRPAPQ